MHARSLLSQQQRTSSVDLFESGSGYTHVARKLQLPPDRVKRLFNRWRIHGRLCLVDKPTKSQYSFDVKKNVVARVLAGETKHALAKEFTLSSPQLVEAWVRRYRNEGDDGLRPKPKGRPRKDPDTPRQPLSELQRAQRENERLRAENAYLKKLRDLRDQELR